MRAVSLDEPLVITDEINGSTISERAHDKVMSSLSQEVREGEQHDSSL